ncbi:MAG: alpha/beta hydrolase [Beijerinckiaceae bacterium]
MSELLDLFPGFASHWVDTDAGRIFARAAGSGPPLALIHGYPQTHAVWHRIAGGLAESFSVVAMDLRGYGQSSAPASDKGERYAKREMGGDVLRVMESLGHMRFYLAGHDRGARVGYRLALDHRERVMKLALLDIIPTITMWEGMNAARAVQVYHWPFLAQPEPLPETLIGGAHRAYIDHTLAGFTKRKSLDAYDERALARYRAFFSEPARIHACCEDYRAGATIDIAHDAIDRGAGRTISCPTLILWGDAGIPAAGSSPLDIWRSTFAPNATGQAIDSGHSMPEENPDATLAALLPFLTAAD